MPPTPVPRLPPGRHLHLPPSVSPGTHPEHHTHAPLQTGLFPIAIRCRHRNPSCRSTSLPHPRPPLVPTVENPDRLTLPALFQAKLQSQDPHCPPLSLPAECSPLPGHPSLLHSPRRHRHSHTGRYQSPMHCPHHPAQFLPHHPSPGRHPNQRSPYNPGWDAQPQNWPGQKPIRCLQSVVR